MVVRCCASARNSANPSPAHPASTGDGAAGAGGAVEIARHGRRIAQARRQCRGGGEEEAGRLGCQPDAPAGAGDDVATPAGLEAQAFQACAGIRRQSAGQGGEPPAGQSASAPARMAPAGVAQTSRSPSFDHSINAASSRKNDRNVKSVARGVIWSGQP